MKLSKRPVLLSLLATAFVGCGGDGDDDNDAVSSIFRGDYSGTYTSSLNDNGSITATISRNGTVTGNVTSIANAPLTGTVTGTVGNDGSFSGTLVSGSNQYTATGTFTRESDGDVVGTLNQTNGSQSAVVQITLSPDVAP